MTQAWDFVNAAILWQKHDEFLGCRVQDIKWYGKGIDVRINNCLINDGVQTIADLLEKTEEGLLRTPNLGRKSLNAIKRVLGEHGLELDHWSYR